MCKYFQLKRPMKTKLTLLLSLTFLFLFSGSVYGGVIDDTLDDVFDRNGEGIGLFCPTWKQYFVINMKEKTVKVFSSNKDRKLDENHKIIKETKFYIMSEDETKKRQYFIDRHTFLEKNILQVTFIHKDKDGKIDKDLYVRCIVGDKVF
jgi:hypothetical protein